MAFDLQDLKILVPKHGPNASRISGNLYLNEHALPHAAIFVHVLICASTFSHADTRHDVMNDVIIGYSVDPFIQVEPVWPIHADPVQTACKKKKIKV